MRDRRASGRPTRNRVAVSGATELRDIAGRARTFTLAAGRDSIGDSAIDLHDLGAQDVAMKHSNARTR